MNIKSESQSAISLLSIIGLFAIFSTTISKNPVLSLYIKSLHADEAVLGLIASISPLAGILFSFPVGFLADRIGKKKILITAAAIFVTAPLLYLLVNNAWWLIPIRFFHGMATAILGPVAAAVICGTYPQSKGEKLGLYSSATLIGRTIAPVAGGAIISAFIFLGHDWNYKLVYITAFLSSIPILIMTYMLKEDAPAEQIKKVYLKSFFSSFRDVFQNNRILGTGLVEMAIYFSFGVFETYLPVYLYNLKFQAYEIGMIFGLQVLAIALSKPLFGKLSDRVDRRYQIIAGILITGLSMAALPLFPNTIMLIVLGITFGLGMSLSTVATSTYVADIAKKEDLGTSMGALSSIMDIGHSGGPLLTGLIISTFSFEAGFAGALVVCALSAVFFSIAAFTKTQGDEGEDDDE